MPGLLKEETALLLDDYFQHRSGGSALPPSPTAAALRRAAAELERRERPFFRSCAPLARAEPREAAALLRRVAEQLEADGGLNWGRLLALVVFAGTLAAALAERGCSDGPGCLAAELATYLAEERGEWLEEHGGWDGFCRFFGRHDSQSADQSSTISNAIMAAAGFGIAGLAFLLAVR
ncbi:bcl-2-like protein 10 [Dryobates pubescens]|uniref:bcl-2-like protein 10 n=1 Tax=Dryobates pubescens TaxID=118200 RepID=UPI0023BA0F31|nr:bcl-2-like protein 10 [Dryobates pubescens]